MITEKCTKCTTVNVSGRRYLRTFSQALILPAPARSLSVKILVYENFAPGLRPVNIGLFGFFKYSFSLLHDYRVRFRT